MAQVPDPIDTLLDQLNQDMGNCLTLLRICVQLRRNSTHLLELLKSMLGDLAENIEQALPSLPGEEDNAHE
jgi:hypothetical protein